MSTESPPGCQQTQHIAAPESTDIQAVARDKVARAICRAQGIAPRDVHPADWYDFIAQADAAISATLQAMLDLELTDEIKSAAGLPYLRGVQDEFRAILRSLQPLLTKEAK